MSIIGNIGGQSGGGSLTKSILIVNAPTGSAVAIKKGSVTKTATEKNGEWWFKNLENGTWTITATLGGQSATESFNITQFGVYRKSITYRLTPEFTYSGSYQVVQDNDSVISDFANWKGNWKIRFLTSGTLTFTNLHGWNGLIDVFLVGGGAGGSRQSGGGGYTKTGKSIIVQVGMVYPVTVAAGGAAGVGGGSGQGKNGGAGGVSSSFGFSADGAPGTDMDATSGGDGGSGAGGSCFTSNGKVGGKGGSDGSNGESVGSHVGGKGQGTTTREFGDPSGKLYAGGAGGNSMSSNSQGGPGGEGGGGQGGQYAYGGGPGETNTGGGGGGAGNGVSGGAGGSGIVVIRNAR